jgi:hypothetical protein
LLAQEVHIARKRLLVDFVVIPIYPGASGYNSFARTSMVKTSLSYTRLRGKTLPIKQNGIVN